MPIVDRGVVLHARIAADPGAVGEGVSISLRREHLFTPREFTSLKVNQAIVKDHDGSILDDVKGFLGNSESANGAGILSHVLGDQRSEVENRLAQTTGLDASSAGQLLETVAPLVMGALGKTQQEQGLDASGLSSFLNSQHQQAQSTTPGLMGVLGNLLDSNKDGSVMDDVSRIAGKLFG
jgi:hypothetical protein